MGSVAQKFRGSSREVFRAEHAKMNNTPIRSGQEPDEYL